VKSDRRGDAVLEYVEVKPRDIEIANRLANEVLGRSLDELPPQTRRFLGLLDGIVARSRARGTASPVKDFWFTRREARDATGWGPTQVSHHLDRLVALEYVLVHRGNARPELRLRVALQRRGRTVGRS
jgi:hypothetical protein